MTPTERARAARAALLRWYARHRRDLPWRRTADPYAIWVSEIMLQQTQVATVVPYYERWIERFPTLEALARAPLDDVLKMWEGLGYYTRARNLHRAARHVVGELGGALPRSADELRRLPGIGPYTAGAIASIAFGHDEPVLDGNVTRVLCRVFRVRTSPKQPATVRRLWRMAEWMIRDGGAARVNQAMMDLGATLCTPRQPECPRCPVRRVCRARELGEQNRLPVKVLRRPVPHHDVPVAAVLKRGRVLIAQRRPEGFLGGLWEFPGGKLESGESLEQCLVRELREELGIGITITAPLAVTRHAYTHFRVTLHAYLCRHASGRPRAVECQQFKWVRPEEFDAYAFPKGSQKIIAALRDHLRDAGS